MTLYLKKREEALRDDTERVYHNSKTGITQCIVVCMWMLSARTTLITDFQETINQDRHSHT